MPMVSRTHCLRLIATVHCSNLDVYFAAIAVGCMLDPNTRCWPVSSHCTHSRRYRSAVIDLFSRQVIGWSMGHRIDTELVLNALLMALWRRQPKAAVTAHSDQGIQFTGHVWQDFLRAHNLVSSMSRRGNCHDNAVAESFFQLLKRERIRRQIYPTRDQARARCLQLHRDVLQP